MSLDEIKVPLQGNYSHRSEHYSPTNYFNSPTQVVRWFSYQNVQRFGGYPRLLHDMRPRL